MADNYRIPDSINYNGSKDFKAIIHEYVENKEKCPEPNICRNDHEIGKVYIPQEDAV